MSHPESPAPSSAPTGDDGPGQGGPTAAGTGGAGAPPARARGRQTALDMVRSLVVIFACVGVVLLLAPQPDEVAQPQVTDGEASSALGAARTQLAADPLLLVPGGELEEGLALDEGAVVPLPQDWRLDYARTEERDETLTWRVGVLSPAERRVDLEQAVAPGEEWLTREDAGRAGLPEPVEVGGLTWTRQERGDGDVAYTFTDPDGGADALTTAVSASAPSDDLQAVVEAVAAALED